MLEAQRRALAAMRAACEHDPAAHPHQRLALDREIGLAAEAADLPSYLGASGSLFEVVRAERLDRAWNQARVGVAVGDRWIVRAAAADHAATLAAADLAELAAAPPPPLVGGEAAAAFTRLVLIGVEQEWTPFPGRSAELAELAESARATLLDADPEFDPGAAEYRGRTPWPGPKCDEPPHDGHNATRGQAPYGVRLERGDWPPGAAGGGPVAVPDTDPGAAYAALAAALPEGDPLREPAAALARAAAGLSAPQAQLRFVSEGLLTALTVAPMRARARWRIERLAEWPDPLVERHWRALLDALDDARTPTEVELASLYGAACLAVEGDWNAILHAKLLAPLRAACAQGATGEVEVEPRAERFLREVAATGAVGAFEGEAGFELINDLRETPLRADVAAVAGPPVTLWEQAVDALDPAAAARPFLAPEPRL